jgi:hypothetical protein
VNFKIIRLFPKFAHKLAVSIVHLEIGMYFIDLTLVLLSYFCNTYYKYFSTIRGFCDCGAGDFGTCNVPSDNLTPLHLAATGGHLNILKFYQEILSDMSSVSSKGWAALHFAAATGQLETVKFLINSIPSDIKTPTGITAYDIAKINYHQHVVD